MSSYAIQVEGLGKQYKVGAPFDKHKTMSDVIAGAISRPFRTVRGAFRNLDEADPNSLWALRDVSFEVQVGEVLGIIGRNGAGKSTLLKVLSRITDPTRGRAIVRGRVGSLLEVGTGFHQELTGRENVILNGAILGMPRSEVLTKFDEIVAFAEVERFIDTPVKRYSTGMRMRLAFSVAAHLDPDILIVDEVLAVGDASFQKKCLHRISDVATEGRTALFVSHSMAAVTSLCSRAILLHNGSITMDGAVPDVIANYLSAAEVGTEDLKEVKERSGTGLVRFEKLEIRDELQRPAVAFRSGEPVVIGLRYATRGEEITGPLVFQIFVSTVTGQRLFTCSNRWARTLEARETSSVARCHISHLPLVPGEYLIEIVCKSDGVIHDHVWTAGRLQVVEGDFFGTGRIPPPSGGPILVEQIWSE
jgi:lipopolysaccharide transport system ATP-binding protein